MRFFNQKTDTFIKKRNIFRQEKESPAFASLSTLINSQIATRLIASKLFYKACVYYIFILLNRVAEKNCKPRLFNYSGFYRRPTPEKTRPNTKKCEVNKTRKNSLNRLIQGTMFWLRGFESPSKKYCRILRGRGSPLSARVFHLLRLAFSAVGGARLRSPRPPNPSVGETKSISQKKNEKRHPIGCLFSFLVAGVGFEPHDLRVMSPTSYQAALPRDMIGAGNRDRTGTGFESHGILSPGRLPIPPLRHTVFLAARLLYHF